MITKKVESNGDVVFKDKSVPKITVTFEAEAYKKMKECGPDPDKEGPDALMWYLRTKS